MDPEIDYKNVNSILVSNFKTVNITDIFDNHNHNHGLQTGGVIGTVYPYPPMQQQGPPIQASVTVDTQVQQGQQQVPMMQPLAPAQMPTNYNQPYTNQYVSHELRTFQGETPVNYSQPSGTTVMTIPKGTILYHGTLTKQTFDPTMIQLGADSLIANFSTNENIAANRVYHCGNYPFDEGNGFIHKFRATKDIENIYVMSVYERDKKMNNDFLYNNYCTQKNVGAYHMSFNGIAFYFAKSGTFNPDEVNHNSEVALCNPKAAGLEYVSTKRCVAQNQYSSEYNFAAPGRMQ